MFKRLFRDTSFALMVEMSHRVANVILFAAVSLFLGAHEAGVYTLAFSYVLIATRMTFWGLDQLLIREASKDAATLSKFFSNFTYLRVGLSLLAWTILCGVTAYSLPQSDNTTRGLMLIYGLSILPESIINLGQAVLIAQQKMYITVIGRAIETLVKVMGGVLVLWLWADLLMLVWMIVLGSIVGMLALLVPILSREVKFLWRIDVHFCREQLRIATPLMIGGMFYIFDSRFDILILSFFLNESAIGIYNAALTIISTLMIVPQAYQVAVFPLMAHLYSTSSDALDRLYGYSLKYMLLLSLFLAVSLTFAPASLVRLFGPEFESAAPILHILSWTLPPLFFNVPVVRLLITDDKQSVTARTMLLRMILGGVLGVLLTWQFQSLGAAGSRLISSSVPVALNYIYASRCITQVKSIHILWFKAFVACAGMVGILLLFNSFISDGLLGLFLAGLAYVLILWWTRTFSREELLLLQRLYHYTYKKIQDIFVST
ncbi:MAG: flippase [Anaerolineae bacterium]